VYDPSFFNYIQCKLLLQLMRLQALKIKLFLMISEEFSNVNRLADIVNFNRWAFLCFCLFLFAFVCENQRL
jgi:hypothetical protein